MYQLRKAAPPPAKKIDIQFADAIRAIAVGEAFDFPIDPKLKTPFASAKHLAKRFGQANARYRWVHGETGTGTVYRVK